jgi:hypothetical protein
MKLTSILNEIKVNPPANKRKAFDTPADLDYSMIYSVCIYQTLDKLLEAYDVDSVEEIVGPGDTFPLVLDNYYKAIKPGDIKVLFDDDWVTSVDGFKSVVLIADSNGSDDLVALLKF